MNTLIITYTIYLAISLALTVWVARTLHRNGRAFLISSFHGDEALADSVNHLLVVGFYLLNFGYISFNLKVGLKPVGAAGIFDVLGTKVGTVLLVLGALHFLNLAIFHRMHRNPNPPPLPAAAGR